MVMPPYWQITPLAVAAVVAGVVYEIGLRRLARRQLPGHALRTWRRSLAFDGALVLLVLLVSGPIERWSMIWLSVHMALHVVEMFYLPPLLIVGAPWVPMVHALPTARRRAWLSAYYRSPGAAPLRAAWAVVAHPLTGLLAFNVVMVLWHIPRIYDWASYNDWVMNWLMAPSFLITGLLFWRLILPSHPWPARATPRFQVIAVVATAFEMLILAMALAIFTKDPWYSMNVAMQGPVAALRDQRWAAAILWVCGDFWAIPALALVVYRLLGSRGGASSSLDRALGRV